MDFLGYLAHKSGHLPHLNSGLKNPTVSLFYMLFIFNKIDKAYAAIILARILLIILYL